MPKMKAIAAVDLEGSIGKNGGLLTHLPEDMRFFRETTEGQTVVMGRKTLESFPGGRPLKNRRNIVLTRQTGFAPDGAEAAESLEALSAILKEDEEVFVIGGGEIYALLLPFCTELLVTRLYRRFGGDVFFPEIEEGQWQLEQGEQREYEGLTFSFDRYSRIKRP